MSTPQLEDGYTRIANELLEALARVRIPGEANQVLNVIIRKTYGYRKKEDRISLGQFSDATGLSRNHVSRGIQRLQELRVITVTKNGGSSPATFGINKCFCQWISPKKGTPEKGDIPENGDSFDPEKGGRSTPEKGDHKRNERKKETTTTTPTAVNRLTVREISILFNQYAGVNITNGGQIAILNDFARDYTPEAIKEAFEFAAAANIEARFFLPYCRTRLARKQEQAQKQAQEQTAKAEQKAKLEIEIGSIWQGIKSGNLYEVTETFGVIVYIRNTKTGEESSLDRSVILNPEKFTRHG